MNWILGRFASRVRQEVEGLPKEIGKNYKLISIVVEKEPCKLSNYAWYVDWLDFPFPDDDHAVQYKTCSLWMYTLEHQNIANRNVLQISRSTGFGQFLWHTRSDDLHVCLLSTVIMFSQIELSLKSKAN